MLTPYRTDTNSLYLTEQLNLLGVDVIFKSIVGDDLRRLVAAAQHGLFRSDIVIFSGGLGPTEDDLTREAVAEALGLKLRRDPEILTRLEQRFAGRGWKMSSNNAKQADVLEGASVLPNPNGTAPGQWLSGEFDARVAPIYKRYSDVETTILAGAGEVELHFKTRASTQDAAQSRVDEVAGVVEEELDDAVFSRHGESLEQIVGYWLQMRTATLAVAESCTGGLLAERITSVSGSSRYFLGGAVVYSNALKTELAGVPAEMIARHGAVSREVAAALAEGIRYRCESTLGVGITGVAGPNGGTAEKPVGLVFHAVASDSGTEVEQRNFPGDRKRIRRFASTMALDMVRKKLM